MTPNEFIAECQGRVAAGGGASAIAALVRVALLSQRHDSSWQGREEFLFRSEDLLIVNVTLAPHAATPVHSHGMWAVVGISMGCEVDRLFARVNESEELKMVEDVVVDAGSAIELKPDAIHSIFNPLATECRGIHIYGGDMVTAPRQMWNPHTGEELPYEGNLFESWCEELTHAVDKCSMRR